MAVTLGEFPDLGRAFRVLSIKLGLEGLNPNDGLVSLSIVQAMSEGKYKEVIEMIGDQIKDNRDAVADILGWDLLSDIEMTYFAIPKPSLC